MKNKKKILVKMLNEIDAMESVLEKINKENCNLVELCGYISREKRADLKKKVTDDYYLIRLYTKGHLASLRYAIKIHTSSDENELKKDAEVIFSSIRRLIDMYRAETEKSVNKMIKVDVNRLFLSMDE